MDRLVQTLPNNEFNILLKYLQTPENGYWTDEHGRRSLIWNESKIDFVWFNTVVTSCSFCSHFSQFLPWHSKRTKVNYFPNSNLNKITKTYWTFWTLVTINVKRVVTVLNFFCYNSKTTKHLKIIFLNLYYEMIWRLLAIN